MALCRCVFVRKLVVGGLVDFQTWTTVCTPSCTNYYRCVCNYPSQRCDEFLYPTSPTPPLPPPANFSPNTVGRSPGAMQLHDRSHTSPVLMPQCDPCPPLLVTPGLISVHQCQQSWLDTQLLAPPPPIQWGKPPLREGCSQRVFNDSRGPGFLPIV
jgi:hypothetical protein